MANNHSETELRLRGDSRTCSRCRKVENIGKEISEAMKAVEADNEELKGVLPRTYTKIDNHILASRLKNFSQIAADAQCDKFGKIYEYFLGNFARAEGQRGGEFFTPTTSVCRVPNSSKPTSTTRVARFRSSDRNE